MFQSLQLDSLLLYQPGCGFIGHNLALFLKKFGHEPIIVDSLSVNNINSDDNTEIKNQNLYKAILENRLDLLKKDNINLVVQDARNYHEVTKLYKSINPDVIIHLAAVSHANRSNKNPHTTFDHSLRTLENSLDYSKSTNTHIIYMSSSMVYGNFESNEVNESNDCKPIGIYGTLKYAGELMIKSYNQVFGLPYTIIRPSALYGERCVSRRVGQIFIENAIQGLDINLPKTQADQIELEQSQPFIIDVNESGFYFIEEDGGFVQVSLGFIEDRFSKIITTNPQIEIIVRGDQETSYQSIAELLSVLQANGATNFSLATQP